jgi:uncharacterized protein YbaR (Trm112 family)/SAM-dependent methyltransferase
MQYPQIEEIIRCPECHGRLNLELPSAITCLACGASYPVVNGIPILLHKDSAFAPEQVVISRETYFASSVFENRLKRKIRRNLPSLATEYNSRDVDQLIHKELPAQSSPLSGLVIGTGEKAGAISERFPNVNWLMTDVDLSYRPQLIADTVGLPIADASFDIVIAEMVLEHVMNITQAALELQRVCKLGGLIVVKVPFCFPWHGVPVDFFRCTPSGLRALFRSSETVYLGKCMGAWGALAYQLDSLVVNATSIRYLRVGAAFFSRFLFGYLKWLDQLSSNKSCLITTAGITFVGRKKKDSFTPREVLQELQQLFGSGQV